MSSNSAGVLEFRSSGFELYLPPTNFKSRFVMFDDSNQIFYDVNYDTELLGNRIPWPSLKPENLRDPAIVFPPKQSDALKIMNFATGFLVSILHREGDKFVAQKLGLVEVKALKEELMNWSALTALKGEELPNEMKAGLMRRLWDRRPGSQHRSIPYVTPGSVLDQMPRRWHTDGAALNYELYLIFAAGAPLASTQHWEVHDIEDQITKSETRAKDQDLPL